MSETILYKYHLSGRRPGTLFGLCASAAMLTFGIYYNAPWYFLLPASLCAGMMLLAILFNPKTGSVLTAEKLQFHNRSAKDTVLIADIASIKVRNWTDGPDTVELTLKSGRAIHVPSLCADSKLAVALRALGVSEAD